MEGVPRLPMMRAALKLSPEKCDFSRKIKWQIRENFNEDPNTYTNEIRELETLRATATHPSIDFSGCSLLKKYYCQLLFLQNRFSFEEGRRDDIYFTWTDMYTGMAYSTSDIKHELASILFNIGALHLNLGAMDNRQTSDGMKMSCSHFQCAAWAFQQMNDKYPQPKDSDLAPDIVRFLATVSLAQAQECILEKSIVDGRKPGIVAKVSAQIVEYYKSALKVLDQNINSPEGYAVVDVTGTKVYKTWKRYAEFKATFHQCIALLYMGIHSEELQKMGERLAYYQAAMDKLNEATKLAKKLDNHGDNINDAVSFTHDVVGGKLKAAEKENEFVYHEKVPERAALPEIKGASLVKGTAFDHHDPEVAGTDIFHRLVPMEAHEASSLYSEEKAKLLRKIGGNVEEKDQELAVFLTSLQVDQLRLHLEPAGLPQELVDRCAAFSVESDAAQSLIDAMSQLSSVFTEVESSLAEIQQLLSADQEQEKLFQQGQGKRPPSMILKELSLEAGRFTEAHAKAADSNLLLHKAINSHLGNIKTLCLPLSEIQAQLPSLQVLEPKDQASVKELQRLLDKVEEMRKQRRMLYSQLREALQADDITKLATHTTDLEALFANELGKHQRLTSLIEQNLSAQEKILVALTEANARYADTRRSTADIQQRRMAMVGSLVMSAEAYPDLLAKCRKGIEFYRKMETNVTKLLQRLRSVVRVQQEEREQQEAATAARSRTKSSPAMPSVSDSNTGGVVPNVVDGPKLKDFLHLMKNKERLEATEPSPVQSFSLAGLSDSDPMLAGEMPSSYAYPYSHRPTPLGAEQSETLRTVPYSTNANHYYSYNPNQASEGVTYPVSSAPAAPGQNYPSAYAFSGPSSASVALPPNIYPGAASTNVPHQPVYQPVSQQSVNSTGNVTSTSSSITYGYPNFANNPYGGTEISSAAYPSAAPSYPSPVNQPKPQQQQLPPDGSQGINAFYQPSSHAQQPQSSSQPSQQPISYAGQPLPFAGSTPLPYAANTSVSMTVNDQQFGQYSSQMAYGYQAVPVPNSSTGLSAPSDYSTVNSYAGSNPYSEQVNSHSFKHGVTGTTNTAPNQASTYQPSAYPPMASGSQQYQQYPYQSNETVPAFPVVPGTAPQSFYQVPSYSGAYQETQVLQPTPAAPAVAPTPVIPAVPASNPVAQVGSNLELLTLLDQSVPMGPGNPAGAVLEPQTQSVRSYPIPSSDNDTSGITTLTTTNTKTTTAAPASLPDNNPSKSGSISSSFEALSNLILPTASASDAAKNNGQTTATKDPLADAEAALKLAAEVDKLDKMVDGLTRKSLNGPTPLDIKWKEVQELQERESARRSISVARCYPMKNRMPDVLPYDHNRIELPTTKDDYINASFITGLSSTSSPKTAPTFIATQAPLPCSLQDFWTMIWQQGVEVVVCLLSDAEMPKNAPVYWPTEKGRDFTSGPWTVSLQSTNVRPYCHERILGVSKQGESKQRVLIHLQFTAWPGNSFPPSPAQFLQLISEVLHCWQQQRSAAHPIVVHCLTGAGRTGLFCLLCTALADLAAGHGLVDLVRVSAALCQQRRNMFRDREHLLFAYQALLYHAQDLLMKRGILSGTGSLQGSPAKKSHPSQEFIHSHPSTPPIQTDEVPVVSESETVSEVDSKSDVEQEVEPTPVPSPPPAAPVEPKKAAGALAILDPANFTLDGVSPQKQRVTKESFANSKSSTQLGTTRNPSDPLSQLDPLWSFTK